MSSLDINTVAGQKTLIEEKQVKNFVEKQYDISYIETPKNEASRIDAMIVKNGVIISVAETKCRQMTIEQLKSDPYNFEWLVTWDKVETGIKMAADLCVSFVGFLFLVPSRVLLVQKISNKDGLINCRLRLEATKTQATVNGGKAVRTNSYINMLGSKEWKIDV